MINQIKEVWKGERRYIVFEVRRRKEEDFAVDSVYCRVVDSDGNVIEEGNGEIDDKEVYYFFDTTKAKYIPDKIYTVCFDVEIVGMPKLLVSNCQVKVKKRICA